MIKVLDKQITDKIAAGEVIERPVSIVKELIENSIDAGATKITVEILNGGKSYIRVTDNGHGIPKDEVETAFLRHATSKINDVKDLDSLYTLGFRGEALASIAAVTRTEIITKTKEQKVAKRVEIHGSNVISSEEIGSEDGTTIIIRDLFYNTPARLKFMKGDNTESVQIIDLLSEIALAYKDIQIRFINNHSVVFSTLGDGNRLNTIMRVFRDVDTKSLVPVDTDINGIHIEGYVSNPKVSRNNRKTQIFFVNGRVIDSKVIQKGIDLGYRERLFEGRYPICFLFLTTDPGTIDVNIHPNKKEVRFDDESVVIEAVRQGILSALETKKAIPEVGKLFRDENNENKEVVKQVDIKSFLSTLEDKVSEHEEIMAEEAVQEVIPHFNAVTVPEKKIIELKSPLLRPFEFDDLKIKGAIFDTYIEATDENTFYLIDQHAAQERIFYEKLVSSYDSEKKDRQQMLFPLIINVSLSNAENESRWLEPLSEMGFSISEFGNGTYRISEIPMFMELSEAEDFINTFIDNAAVNNDMKNTVVIDKLIMMSCKAAIKAHDRLSLEEMQALINDLKLCRNPYSCPHGRPTVIRFTQYEIERMFKRA
ncbi:MAG: DNA mismatch repair endonuclease MutL [Clostridia bacterium]|nr:DNA mismatch repair endonuclease MutL [Clostridia bacterium]